MINHKTRTCRFHMIFMYEQGSYASGNFLFFQGQGIVREFHDVSGKNEILPKCQGIIREFCYSRHDC